LARSIDVSVLTDEIARLAQDTNTQLPPDVSAALRAARQAEVSALGKEIIDQLVHNQELASQEAVPLCQDTGLSVVFLEIGQEVIFEGGALDEAVQEGVRRGYRQGYLRTSIVADPLRRNNTGDNTPAVIHTTITGGEKVRMWFVPKGGGSENTSALAMLKPADGREGVTRFVLETVERAGPNACPPIIVGVGIGGNFELSALLAKKAILRTVGSAHADAEYAAYERELLAAINALGIGPQGFGGRVTALAVHIETHPCHIASLPVAVNIQCHAARHAMVVI